MNKYKFAIENFEEILSDTDDELAIVRVDMLSTRRNSHRINITEDILRKCAKTILGKWLVGQYNDNEDDVKGHEVKQDIYGYFPNTQEIDFRIKDGNLVASADAVISKIYTPSFYNIIKKDGMKDVSVEMYVYGQRLADNSEDIDIDGFKLTGVTVLGREIAPACKDANVKLVEFSQKSEDFYTKMEKEKYTNHPIDTSKEAVDFGEWDGEKAKRDLLKEKDFEEKGKIICLDFQGGERILENCKYPVMNIKNGKWVYNAKGLSSARAYGEQHDEKVANKAIKIQKALGLYKDGKENMSTMNECEKLFIEKFGELEGRKLYEKVISLVHEHLGEDYYVESIYDDKVVVVNEKTDERRELKADIEVGDDDDAMKVEIEFACDGEKKLEADEDGAVMAEGDGDGEAEPTEEPDGEGKEDAKMSLNENADLLATIKLLEEQTAKNEELAKQLEEKENIIMAMNDELEQLRAYKMECEGKEKEQFVAEVLSKIKGKVDEESYAEFEKAGAECKFDELQGWKNSVFANFAEVMLAKEEPKAEDDTIKMSVEIDTKTVKSLWERL